MIPIILDKSTPNKTGQYLWRGSRTQATQLITLVYIETKTLFGITWPAYLAVKEMGNKDVKKLTGKFSDEIVCGMFYE